MVRPVDVVDGAVERVVSEGAGGADAVVREVYERHRDRVIGFFVRRTGDRAVAEDLAHDTFVRLAAAVDRLDRARPVWPYLRAIASNVLIDHHRVESRQVDLDVEGALVDEPVPGDDLDDTVVLRSLLDRAIGDLSERQRVAVELRCARGWAVSESAEFLGIDPGAFRQLLFRARQNLREALDETGARVRGLVLPVLLDLRMRTRMTTERVREFVQPATSLGAEALAGVAVATTIGVTAVVGITGAEAEPHQPSPQVLELVRQDVAPPITPPVERHEQELAVGVRHTAGPAAGVAVDASAGDAPPPSSRKATVIEAPEAVPDSSGNVTVEDDEEEFVVSSELKATTGLTQHDWEGDDVSVSCGSLVGQVVCGADV